MTGIRAHRTIMVVRDGKPDARYALAGFIAKTFNEQKIDGDKSRVQFRSVICKVILTNE